MDYLTLNEDNHWLRKRVLQLELELKAERKRNSDNVDLLMKGESLRQQIMLGAILVTFPPKIEAKNEI